MDFIIDNLVWFIVGGIAILMIIVGYFAEKTDFGRNAEPKEKVKKEKNKESKKEEAVVAQVDSTPAIETSNVEPVMPTFEVPTIDNNNVDMPVMDVPAIEQTPNEVSTNEVPVDFSVSEAPGVEIENAESTNVQDNVEEVSQLTNFQNESVVNEFAGIGKFDYSASENQELNSNEISAELPVGNMEVPQFEDIPQMDEKPQTEETMPVEEAIQPDENQVQFEMPSEVPTLDVTIDDLNNEAQESDGEETSSNDNEDQPVVIENEDQPVVIENEDQPVVIESDEVTNEESESNDTAASDLLASFDDIDMNIKPSSEEVTESTPAVEEDDDDIWKF